MAKKEQVTRRQLSARRAVIPATPDVREREVSGLAAGIDLMPGELRVRFDGAEDLAAKLFELSQAMANDWTAFTKFVKSESHAAS